MQLSTIVTLALAISPVFSLPIAAPETTGSSTDVEFPFSSNAIIKTVKLSDNVAPLITTDAVLFINTTIADDTTDTSLLQKRSAYNIRTHAPFRMIKAEESGAMCPEGGCRFYDYWIDEKGRYISAGTARKGVQPFPKGTIIATNVNAFKVLTHPRLYSS
ncbi:CYFA0S20e00650g1_1 [Cyberlindnera fabianii]|uniref:CYFA0S20e00650g1_1 n=1 Tax=Cyberlindnera fabianii TaxID=36022 RepID=A0A061B8X9_CYBFA|nr:hypothetical protein BON22_0857 [Cyberlindnera fabianii]CDR45829.1 CYFA0S20e00650g1_1 [Cyberlindnera fabianii]